MDTFTLLPAHGWLARLTGRNALLRRSDRLEAFAAVVAVILAICAVPIAAALGTATHDARLQFYVDQARHRHHEVVTAVSDSVTTVRPNSVEFNVDARWNAGGTDYVERVESPGPMKAEEQFQIWVDDSGAPATAPRPPSQAAQEAVGAAVVSWLGVFFVVAGMFGVVRHQVNRARHA